MSYFSNKTIIITGGGILDNTPGLLSYEIEAIFASEGANLILTGDNIKSLEELAKNLEYAYETRVLPIETKLGRSADNEAVIKQVIDKTVDCFGGIDILINDSQDYDPGKSFLSTTKQDLNRAVYSGIFSYFYYMKYAYPYLKESQGSIINICTKLRNIEDSDDLGFVIVRDAIKGLTRTAAREWEKDGINVNMISMASSLRNLSKPEEINKDIDFDITTACLALASPSLNYITGECISLGDGLNLRI